MNGRKYSKMLTIILIIIIVAIIGLLGFLAFSYYKQENTISDASEYVDAFDSTISTEVSETSENSNTSTDTTSDTTTTEETNTATTTSTEKTYYKGFEVLGTIEIPETDVKYPILAKLSAKALNTSVVAIFPSSPTLNTVGNVVISGHNYRNGTFFSDNKQLSVGDKIYITDLEGTEVTYYIYSIFEASEDDTSFYNRDTDGKMEITLSTCTDDASARLIILASNEEVE